MGKRKFTKRDRHDGAVMYELDRAWVTGNGALSAAAVADESGLLLVEARRSLRRLYRSGQVQLVRTGRCVFYTARDAP